MKKSEEIRKTIIKIERTASPSPYHHRRCSCTQQVNTEYNFSQSKLLLTRDICCWSRIRGSHCAGPGEGRRLSRGALFSNEMLRFEGKIALRNGTMVPTDAWCRPTDGAGALVSPGRSRGPSPVYPGRLPTAPAGPAAPAVPVPLSNAGHRGAFPTRLAREMTARAILNA